VTTARCVVESMSSSWKIDAGGRQCSYSGPDNCGHQYRAWSEFTPSWSRAANNRHSHCKCCMAAQARARRAADPEAERLYQFESGLKRKFNITLEQYQALGEAQGWVCALCGEPETRLASGKNTDGKRVQSLSVDHDHSCCPGSRSCGKCIRGLLCAHCNWLVGRLEGRRGSLVAVKLPDYLIQRPLSVGVGSVPASLVGGEQEG
jgi:hypothetical protein